MGLHLLHHPKTWSPQIRKNLNMEKERVKKSTQKLSYRARWLRELDPELSDEIERNIGHNVVFTKISSSVTEARKEIIYTDNAKEFMKACQYFQWNHDSSTSHRSGVPERAVRRVKERTAISLVQRGPPEEWWDSDGMLLSLAQRARQNGLCATCGRRWSGDLIEDYEDLQESEASEIDVKRSNNQEIFVKKRDYESPCANRTLRLLSRPRPSWTGRKPLARRWCWCRRKRQKGKQNRRFVGPWVEHLFFDTMKKSRLKLLRTRWWTIPNPIERYRRSETNSDECRQCLWTCYHWLVDWDHKIPVPTCKTSWRIHVGKWKTHENPKDYHTRK